MLRSCACGHVASNSTPFREHRLLWFASPEETPRNNEPIRLNAEVSSNEPVTTAQNSTRGNIQGALGHSEAQQPMAQLLERAEKVEESLQTTVAAMTEFSSQARGQLKGPDRASWNDNLEFLRMGHQEIQSLKRGAEILADYESGAIPPIELLQVFEDDNVARAIRLTEIEREEGLTYEEREAHMAKRELYRNMRRALPKDDPAGMRWQTGNVPTQLEARAAFEQKPIIREDDGETLTVGNVKQMIKEDIDRQLKTWESVMQTAQTEFNQMKQALAQAERSRVEAGGDGIIASAKAMRDAIPISFYTVNEIWDAGKSVIEAYKESYKQYTQLRSASMAKKMGKVISFLPWGRDVEQILDREVDERNDGIASKYADYLKSRNASYKEIFGPDGELTRNRLDGNRARGVLDYASHRGWLYDVDLHTKAADGNYGFRLIDGTVLSYGQLVPKDWDKTRIEDAYSKLITAQNSGKKEEAEKYKNRYYNIDRADDFVTLAEKEMKNYNIWAVKGIMERSIERGLAGEVSPLHAVTIMQKLEADPILRRLITRDWLDQIGLISIYRSAFVLGAFKADRNTFAPWLESGDGDIRKAGTFGKLMYSIREDILTRTGKAFAGDEGERELRSKIAQVLAAQVVQIPDQKNQLQTFSIFQNRYKEFRESDWINQQSDLAPGIKEEDPDFFTNISENHWAGERPIAEIFARTGQGEFANLEKAMYYTNNLLSIYSGLHTAGDAESAENYRREMGEKLSRWIWQSPLGDSRSPGLDAALIKGDKKHSAGEPALSTLIQEGFIDVEPIIRAVWDKRGGQVLAGHLLKKNNAQLFAELEAARSEADKTKDQAEVQRLFWDIVEKWRNDKKSVKNKVNFVKAKESVTSGSQEPVEIP